MGYDGYSHIVNLLYDVIISFPLQCKWHRLSPLDLQIIWIQFYVEKPCLPKRISCWLHTCRNDYANQSESLRWRRCTCRRTSNKGVDLKWFFTCFCYSPSQLNHLRGRCGEKQDMTSRKIMRFRQSYKIVLAKELDSDKSINTLWLKISALAIAWILAFYINHFTVRLLLSLLISERAAMYGGNVPV